MGEYLEACETGEVPGPAKAQPAACCQWGCPLQMHSTGSWRLHASCTAGGWRVKLGTAERMTFLLAKLLCFAQVEILKKMQDTPSNRALSLGSRLEAAVSLLSWLSGSVLSCSPSNLPLNLFEAKLGVAVDDVLGQAILSDTYTVYRGWILKSWGSKLLVLRQTPMLGAGWIYWRTLLLIAWNPPSCCPCCKRLEANVCGVWPTRCTRILLYVPLGIRLVCQLQAAQVSKTKCCVFCFGQPISSHSRVFGHHLQFASHGHRRSYKKQCLHSCWVGSAGILDSSSRWILPLVLSHKVHGPTARRAADSSGGLPW